MYHESLEQRREAMEELREAKRQELEEYRQYKEELRQERDHFRTEERKKQQEGWDRLMLESGFIDRIDANYKMSLNNKSLRINGKKQSKALHEKFIKFYEESRGKKISDNFSVSIVKS